MSNDKQTEELAIATAVWSILREVEDECDKEVEDLHFRHHVWDIANAVRAALSSRPVQGGGELKFTGVDDTQQMHRVRMLLESQGVYWGASLIASLIEAALSSAPAREPMTDEQVEPMFRARKAAPAEGIKDEWYWYAWGVEDAERHHGITKE